MSEVQEFMDGLSARMEGDGTADKYVENREHALTKLKEIKEKVMASKITNIEEYKEAMALKSIISSLWCYTFNHDKKELFEDVSNLENDLGQKIAKFARSYGRVRGELSHVVKYVCHQAGWRYRGDDTKKIAQTLLENNLLYKDEHGNYYATGLHLAVGDNVFGFSNYTGRQWRLYVKVCVIQAFSCNGLWRREFERLEKDGVIEVPPLPEFYYKTGVGDYKNCARIYLSRKEKNTIWNNYLSR